MTDTNFTPEDRARDAEIRVRCMEIAAKHCCEGPIQYGAVNSRRGPIPLAKLISSANVLYDYTQGKWTCGTCGNTCDCSTR